MTDATLRVTIRAALIAYRETVIYKHWAGDQTRRKRCILRRDMIEHLIARRPFTVKAWMDSLPRGMRDKTDMGQVQAHGESIIEIIREQRVRAYRRHLKEKGTARKRTRS